MGVSVSKPMIVVKRHKRRKKSKLTESTADESSVQFDSTHGEIPAMFFSWLSYDYFLNNKQAGLIYSERNFPLLKGYGGWRITHEFFRDTRLQIVHAFIAVSESRRQAIVAFRGTEITFKDKTRRVTAVNDWLFGSLDTKHTDWRTGQKATYGTVHYGYLKQYRSINSDLNQKIRDYATRGYHVIFTGHSQGAGLATLAALECAEYCSYRNLFLITFGSPRVGGSKFCKYFNSLIPASHVFRYVSNVSGHRPVIDAITQIPSKNMGFKHVKSQTRYILARKDQLGNCMITQETETHKIPKSICCHMPETYMDGILSRNYSVVPLTDRTAKDVVSEEIKLEASFISKISTTFRALSALTEAIRSESESMENEAMEALQAPHIKDFSSPNSELELVNPREAIEHVEVACES